MNYHNYGSECVCTSCGARAKLDAAVERLNEQVWSYSDDPTALELVVRVRELMKKAGK